jgi:peptidoglycan/xylan/chitin deacetylase (PgdA/CDA1 family)
METAQRIVFERHVLGCHGYHHDPFTSLSTKEMNEQLTKFILVAGQVVPRYRVRFFRPPYGDRNPSVRKEAARLGMQTVMWSLSSGGQDENTYQRVVDGTKRGAIILSHSTRYYDVNQALKIVTGLANSGYSLESMDTGLDPKDYWKNNQTTNLFQNRVTKSPLHEPR